MKGSKLSARRAQSADRGNVAEFLALRLGSELYGVPLSHVREILVSPPLTVVPRAPHDVLGIINVRGQLITVIDLKARLGLLGDRPLQRPRVLLVPGPEGELLGLSVDEVLQVYRLAESEIEPAGVLGGNVAEHVAGIGRRDGVLLILLSLSTLLGGGPS
ncbi:MAG: chemotaxis protein CheW [Myxococcales bacterium]|nr:chemotaxis protein CheW [Polyangiaceae bacterium]MDW8248477.1 chemotaxis protein CheW [Myxococcales bacterium]